MVSLRSKPSLHLKIYTTPLSLMVLMMGIKPTNDTHRIMAELERVGSQTLTELLLSLSKEGNPVSYLIYTLLLPWAADVARYMSIPSAFLCIQSTTAFALCYCFFEEEDGVDESDDKRPPGSIEMHGLPLFTSRDIPSFLLPDDPHASTLIPVYQQHIQALKKDSNPCVLLNTSDSLEEEAIRVISSLNPIPIGPLVSYAFLDENNSTDSTCSDSREFEEKIKDKVNEGVGLIVPWCSQMEVLTHESIGCFMMHCGWNSTVESLATGVPVVGFPQFSDQTTNAKMVEEVWRTGARARVNEEGTLEAEEIERCLEMVMGQRGEEMRRNAKKWKALTLEAVMEGGSSYNNLKAFLERIE
ncbi:GLUCOSYL/GLUCURONOSYL TRANSFERASES [Salix purpurea]|uniref:anthocyanidin 3-O-glucosyltransferase n=1 Tax=Salix purpurea TaxID=77065 RepID=A0A9Q0URT2_SALPP|nr:GLUCOSYL/GLUCURONOSYL TRANSFERASES [Salix purpurea]